MGHLPERYHSLDFLRAFAMLLGIFLHAILSFTELPVPFWPAHDSERSVIADVFVCIVHDFRMQTFFLLAGFFSGLLYQRYYLSGMLKRRLLRIGVPFAAALLIIVPTLEILWLLGDLNAVRYVNFPVDAAQPPADRIADLFLSGRFLTNIVPFHLWFLYFLIVYAILMAPLGALGQVLTAVRVAGAGDRIFRKLVSVPGRAFLLAALTAPLLWPSQIRGLADTQDGWAIKPHLCAYYFLFFISGWMLWRHRDLLPVLTRRWPLALTLGNLLVAPAFLLVVHSFAQAKNGLAEVPGVEHGIAACYLSALYTWLMISGLMGAFQHYFDGHRAWVRYLADASYWCYLWHLTPVIALQILLEQSALPGPIKFIIITGVSMALLLITYEWCVRYTFIGAILNGRKHRQSWPEATEAPAAELKASVTPRS